MSTLTFLGSTGTVTGSRFHLKTPEKQLLIDCGLFQGPKELEARNAKPFAYDAKEIDAVITLKDLKQIFYTRHLANRADPKEELEQNL